MCLQYGPAGFLIRYSVKLKNLENLGWLELGSVFPSIPPLNLEVSRFSGVHGLICVDKCVHLITVLL